MRFDRPMRVVSRDVERVWGGQRLRRADPPIGEVWLVSGDAEIVAGPCSGLTLDAAVAAHGAAIVGRDWSGLGRFPLLIKLIDSAGWLSLQVHPDDAQAVSFEGEGASGKSEAWHVLDAAPGAEVMAGFDRPVDLADLDDPAARRDLVAATRRFGIRPGDTLYLAAGTVHAIGPGLVIYEVQQPSDITYRVYDWDRPASAARPLHIDQARAVIDTHARVEPLPIPAAADGAWDRLVTCRFFTLDTLTLCDGSVTVESDRAGCHVLTAVEGQAMVTGEGWEERLIPHESLVLPAGLDGYHISGMSGARLLRAGGPGTS